MTLLNNGVSKLPKLIADAIEEERIEDILAYLRTEIMGGGLEGEVGLDAEQGVIQMVGSD